MKIVYLFVTAQDYHTYLVISIQKTAGCAGGLLFILLLPLTSLQNKKAARLGSFLVFVCL